MNKISKDGSMVFPDRRSSLGPWQGYSSIGKKRLDGLRRQSVVGGFEQLLILQLISLAVKQNLCLIYTQKNQRDQKFHV